MNFDWAEWGPPLAVLAFGLFAGIASAMQLRRRDEAVQVQGREQDLIEAHEAALEALKSLELDQGKLEPADYLREREALLVRGAAALRELEAFRAGKAGAGEAGERASAAEGAPSETAAPAAADSTTGAPPAAAPPAGPEAKPLISPEWKGALTALAVVGVVALMMQLAGGDAVPRREGASMTGNQDLGDGSAASAQGEAPWKQAQAELEAQLEREPQNIDVVNQLTQLTLSVGDATAAMQYNQQAFEIDPENADAKVFKAVLAATVGLIDRALTDIDAVIAENPLNDKAWAYKGLILLEERRADEAVAALEKAVELQPAVPGLRQALERAKALGNAEVVVSGVAELPAEQAAALTGREILYVSVRDPAGGPPLAALRLPPGPFPVSFEVTTADAIAMGGAPRTFPDAVNLSVRIDADGDPMTRGDEPKAEMQGVEKGSSGLQLTLQ